MPSRTSPAELCATIDQRVSVGLTTYVRSGPAPWELRAAMPTARAASARTMRSFPNMCSHYRGEHPFVSSDFDQLRDDFSAAHPEAEIGVERRPPPPLGRRARIEEPDVAMTLGLRLVGVSEDDRVAAREPAEQPLLPPGRRPRDVDHPDPHPFDLDHELLRQPFAEGRLVGV